MNIYESEPISQLPPIVSLSALDVLPITDVNDPTESPSGSTKKVTVQQLADYIVTNLPWVTVTAGPITLTTAQGYIANGSALINFQLPDTALVGDQFRIEGYGAGFFQINQNAGQSIIFDSFQTTVGIGGYITSTTAGDGLTFMCVEENTTFKVRNFIGTLITT